MAQEGERSPFGTRLRQLREAAGLTQEELAERAGLTADAIAALERGRRRRPYPHTLRALADALGLPEEGRAALAAEVSRRGGTAIAPERPRATLPIPPMEGRALDGLLAASRAMTREQATEYALAIDELATSP